MYYTHTHIYIYYMGWWSQGARARVILVLRECIWDAPAVSLVLPTFGNTSSLGSPPYWVYIPLVLPKVTVSHFLVENREAELKPTTFSLLLLFHVFLSFLFS